MKTKQNTALIFSQNLDLKNRNLKVCSAEKTLGLYGQSQIINKYLSETNSWKIEYIIVITNTSNNSHVLFHLLLFNVHA